MSFSFHQVTAAVVTSFCLGALAVPVATRSDQPAASPAAADQPKFMVIEFMKIAPGKMGDWTALERKTWKPIHQMRGTSSTRPRLATERIEARHWGLRDFNQSDCRFSMRFSYSSCCSSPATLRGSMSSAYLGIARTSRPSRICRANSTSF